jgi:hypothetical protein
VAAVGCGHTACSLRAANGFAQAPKLGRLPVATVREPVERDPNAHLPLPLSPFRGDSAAAQAPLPGLGKTKEGGVGRPCFHGLAPRGYFQSCLRHSGRPSAAARESRGAPWPTCSSLSCQCPIPRLLGRCLLPLPRPARSPSPVFDLGGFPAPDSRPLAAVCRFGSFLASRPPSLRFVCCRCK